MRLLARFVWIVCLIGAATAGFGNAAEFYVSPRGDDSNLGTAERPFRTIDRARQAVRKIAGREPADVFLDEGTYYLDDTIVFTPDDSGTPDAPVTYQARPGANPVISGGRRLELAWRPSQNGILQARVPDDVTEIDQLFVAGKRRPLARWPDYREGEHGVDVGYARGLEPRPGEPASRVTPPLQPFSTLAFDPQKFTPRRWAHPETAVLHIFQSQRWSNLQWRLKAIDYESHRIALGEGGWQIGTLWHTERANRIGGGSPYFIENVFEELDAPGEWYFDAPNHVLHYLPHEHEDIATAEVVGCVLKELIVLAGTAENPVHDLHFRGITFAHTARTMLEPYETRLRGDWAIARRAALRFDGAADCSVVDCRFVHLGGNAVLLSNYNRRVEVADSLFTDIGDSAVLAVGSDDAVRELRVHRTYHVPLDELTDLEPGPKSPNYPGECTIRNNLMYRLGIVGKQTAGVYLSACERIHVSHNTICLVPRAAICINDGCWGGHLIEFNDAFLTVLETSDHGPLNAWGRDRYWQSLHRENKPCDMTLSKRYAVLDNHLPTVIRNNRFAHDGFSWGIDLDDGASNYIVESNLCLGCSVKLREGFFRRVHHNIFVGPNPPSKHCCFEDNDDVITNNIVVNTRDAWAINRGPATVHLPKEIDRNVYWNTPGEPPLFGYQGAIDGESPRRRALSLAQWQALGADTRSVFADPRFVDLEHGDFRLRPDSPALRLGFRPFPLDRFGTQKPEFVALLSAEGLRPQGTADDSETVFDWLGAALRNGPQGIALFDVPQASEAYRLGFRRGDVLIRMNETDIANVPELIGAISAAPATETRFVVRRGNRQEMIVSPTPGGVPSPR